jgi:hypothetical protein
VKIIITEEIKSEIIAVMIFETSQQQQGAADNEEKFFT